MANIKPQCHVPEVFFSAQENHLILAVQVITRRVGTAPVAPEFGFSARARQTGLLVVGVESNGNEILLIAQTQFTIYCILFDAVIFPVIVVFIMLGVQPQSPVFATDLHAAAQIARIVAADLSGYIAGQRSCNRRAGDDVDRAAACSATVKNGARAA